MPLLSLQVKTNIEIVRQGLQNFEKEPARIGRLGLYRASQRIVKSMKKPVRRPAYPIGWVSDKQRRAFFATNGFGHGIPSKRSGEYQSGYKIISLPDGYAIENNSDGAEFVGGDENGNKQSPIHAGRWPLFSSVIQEEVAGLPAEIEENIMISAKQHGL
mgnify:CR=1 FL=1